MNGRSDPPETAATEAAIVAVWHENATPWERAVRGGSIASRVTVTDRAIVAAVLECAPRSVIDVGCGEGWLGRALAEHGVDAFGVDAVPALVDSAERQRPARHVCLTYEALASRRLAAGPFDAAACNFSLLGEDSVRELLAGLHGNLSPGGHLVVQTLHPDHAADGDAGDGWRTGSWRGCGDGFGRAAPWYFRTRASWRRLLADTGYTLMREIEPAAAPGAAPASLILVGERPG